MQGSMHACWSFWVVCTHLPVTLTLCIHPSTTVEAHPTTSWFAILRSFRSPQEHHECADEECSAFFFNELARLNDSQATAVLDTRDLGPNELPGLAGTSGIFACLILGTQVVAKTGQDREADKVLVSLAVVRLPQVGSDVLISLNVPVQGSDMASAEQPNLLAANSLMHRMLESLHIHDWGLFGS
eukprot:366212-Chlamydomonas_euryale.AAC.50